MFQCVKNYSSLREMEAYREKYFGVCVFSFLKNTVMRNKVKLKETLLDICGSMPQIIFTVCD